MWLECRECCLGRRKVWLECNGCGLGVWKGVVRV